MLSPLSYKFLNMKDDEVEVNGTVAMTGEIKLDHPKVMRTALSRFVGKRLMITIKQYKYIRTDAQNRYIHGVVVPVVRRWFLETSGENLTKDEVYMWLRTSLLGHKPTITEVNGESLIKIGGKRFSQMTTEEFAEAIDAIVDRMAERGCQIPLPPDKKANTLNDFLPPDKDLTDD